MYRAALVVLAFIAVAAPSNAADVPLYLGGSNCDASAFVGGTMFNPIQDSDSDNGAELALAIASTANGVAQATADIQHVDGAFVLDSFVTYNNQYFNHVCNTTAEADLSGNFQIGDSNTPAGTGTMDVTIELVASGFPGGGERIYVRNDRHIDRQLRPDW
ncbi:MAG: hypothetical protein ACRC1K_09795 [Planctomycetia bacterium]